MKPTNHEYRQLLEQEKRLIKFKEANFETCGYGNPATDLIWVIIFSIPVIGQGLLILTFLIEWYLKVFRMTMIVLTQIKLTMIRFNYAKLLLVLVFIFMVLFILANIFG